MKQCPFVVTILFLFVLVACGSSSNRDTKQLNEQVKQTTKKNSPGTIPTSEKSYFMKASINGKPWIATHMMPDDEINSSYVRIHGENGGDYMNFQLWKKGIEPGKKFSFDQERAANLSLEGDAGFWGGTSGEVEITKLDAGWMEGKFAYRATSSSSTQTIEVTDGFFRVPFAGNARQ